MKVLRAGLLFILAITFLTPGIMAFTGTGWLPDYSAQLGMRDGDSPGVDEEFSQFEAVIEDSAKFKELAGVEIESGAKVTVNHAGNMRWSTDVDGVPVKPAALRLKINDQDKILVFLPDKETVKLKLYKRPPFRSSAVPRKPKSQP